MIVTAPSLKTALLVGMTSVLTFGAVAACSNPSQAPVDATPVGAAAGTEAGAEATPEVTPEPEYTYEPEYTCRSLVSEMTQMSEEQYTSSTTLLAGIKRISTVRDKQLNPPRNGWVLECEGVAIWSGEPNSDLTFGIRNEGGQTFLSYKEQSAW